MSSYSEFTRARRQSCLLFLDNAINEAILTRDTDLTISSMTASGTHTILTLLERTFSWNSRQACEQRASTASG